MESLSDKLLNLATRYNSDQEEFQKIIQSMLNLYINKNSDYGNSFEDSCNEFGLMSPAIRMSDKLNRFKTLIKQDQKVKNEKLEDTLIDLANYAIMTVIWLRKQNDLSSNK